MDNRKIDNNSCKVLQCILIFHISNSVSQLFASINWCCHIILLHHKLLILQQQWFIILQNLALHDVCVLTNLTNLNIGSNAFSQLHPNWLQLYFLFFFSSSTCSPLYSKSKLSFFKISMYQLILCCAVAWSLMLWPWSSWDICIINCCKMAFALNCFQQWIFLVDWIKGIKGTACCQE